MSIHKHFYFSKIKTILYIFRDAHSIGAATTTLHFKIGSFFTPSILSPPPIPNKTTSSAGNEKQVYEQNTNIEVYSIAC